MLRTSILAALAILIAPCASPQPHRPPPPPMFSPAYVDALKGVIDLEPTEVKALENRLANDPEDFATRVKLMAYCMRADRVALESSRRERIDLALWLIEHHPDSEILASPYAAFDTKDLSGESLDRAVRLWHVALEKYPNNAKVLWNAASFYLPRDRQGYLHCAEAAAALAPEDERRSTSLGLFYAQQIVDQTGFAPLAIERLDTSRNAFVLEGAVKLLQSVYNRSLMLSQNDHRLGDLAARYFARAKALDPNLDADWVYQQIDPKMIGMLAPGAHPPAPLIPANANYRRLKPDAFPDLPAAIASVLRMRACMIPQPSADGSPRNVIRGEFFEKGQKGWAVLCAARGSSAILAFRSDADSQPAELAKMEMQGFIDRTLNGAFVYNRQIRAVDLKFIIEHYRAYGGPQPPPIDHQGIDDGSEHGSVTHYWYKGQWRKLTGSD